jgi:predicted lipoprotein with Yx(FWY)xxD motif
MKQNYQRFNKQIIGIIGIITLIVLASCAPVISNPPVTTPSQNPASPPAVSPSPAPVPPSYTVMTASKAGIGDYLVDSKAMALYYFSNDRIGKSTAVGPVLQAWPLFSPAALNVPTSLQTADFGTITRDDGLKVATYKGWPLYYFVKDQSPGDTLGEAVGGVWFLIKVPFYTVMLETSADLGNYLVDAKGMTLYYFTKDSLNKSTATAAIIGNWPVFSAATFVIPSSLKSTDFGTINRDDGAKQATYKGWPLYYFAKDQTSGDTLGQGVNGVWYVVNPDKISVATQPAAAPAPTPGYGGGGGY